MAEYNFDELVNEVANNKKRFAEYAFSKDKAQLESTKEVFALACEQIANVYLPYGFTYAKGNKHLSLKQKNNEFIYKISFWSSQYNVPGENVIIEVFADVSSHQYKKWKTENKTAMNFSDSDLHEIICRGNIGILRKEQQFIKWNIGNIETREKQLEDIIEHINHIAIPIFQCFDNIELLQQKLERGRLLFCKRKKQKCIYEIYQGEKHH